MAERIDMWKSTDGKLHGTESDADFRNTYLEIYEQVDTEFYMGCCETITNFLDFTLNNRGAIEKLLALPEIAD